MAAIEVKIFLLRRNLSIQEAARAIRSDGQTEQSARVMLSQMINGQRFYPAMAERFYEEFGVRIPRPAHLRAAA